MHTSRKDNNKNKHIFRKEHILTTLSHPQEPCLIKAVKKIYLRYSPATRFEFKAPSLSLNHVKQIVMQTLLKL